MNPLTQKFLALIFSVQAAVVFSADAEEIILRPDGVNADAGWALSRVGEEFSGAAINTYAYPDTTVPVRLYLIDTGIANPASFVAANPNLTFEGSIPVGGIASIPRTHGTQMLSLIAGKETGVASGTPIHLLNYDIYTADVASETTTISYLATAIIKALQHHRNPNTLKMRAVICMATSTQAMTNSYAVEDSINQALAAGSPVVVSAGNLTQNIPVLNYTAATTSTNISYLPAAYGTKNGVICVGASDSTDLKISNSNFGAPVDILAPGLDVRTRGQSATSAFESMTGTSPAAALVAGAVLAKLSASPTHTPAGIESALKAAAETAAAGPVLRSVVALTSDSIPPDVAPDGPVTDPLIPVSLAWAAAGVSPPASVPGGNSSQLSHIVDVFHHGNHPSQSGPPPHPQITRSSSQETQFSFPVAGDLFDRLNPFLLRNGYTWRIRSSTTLPDWSVPDWSVPVGRLSKSTDSNGRVWLTATFPASEPSCYATIEITAP